MQRALLAELQAQRAYPSITILFNTLNGSSLEPGHLATAASLINDANQRLKGDVTDSVRAGLIDVLKKLIEQQSLVPAAHALAVFASPQTSGTVRLAKFVTERVIIDETFATRDLVADLNRTAQYRVVTISDQRARMFLGDRDRLVEEQTDSWPLVRSADISVTAWSASVTAALTADQNTLSLPVVFGGVTRSLRRTLPGQGVSSTIGIFPGNHDRTGWTDLHHIAWPIVTDWLRSDTLRAMELLESARSQRRYAGGLEEIWTLACEGRIEQLVVEETFSVAATLAGNTIIRSTQPTAPDVTDDIVDELIEVVLAKAGTTVFVPDGELHSSGRIAAILRF